MSTRLHSYRATLVALLSLLLCAQSASARPRGPGFGDPSLERPGARVERQLRKHLIPPRLLMRHMDELKLTEEQQAQLKALMKSAQGELIDLRFELKASSKALIEAVKDTSSAEEEVLKRADTLMALEAKHKRARLKTALKLRALLTPTQLKTAKALKAKARQRFKERRASKKRSRRWGKRGAHLGERHCEGEGCEGSHE